MGFIGDTDRFYILDTLSPRIYSTILFFSIFVWFFFSFQAVSRAIHQNELVLFSCSVLLQYYLSQRYLFWGYMYQKVAPKNSNKK
jgi:hypothetical protein